MKEYETLVDLLVDMAKISRPAPTQVDRESRIQHGICDLLEDAAVAIDDLMNKLKEKAKADDKQLETA